MNHLQIGRYAEYFVKMECVVHGLDVYTAEVDNRGFDFVICIGSDRHYDVQVKSCRSFNYIFFPKPRFALRENLPAAVVIFLPEEPSHLFLIPSIVWRSPNGMFVSRGYEGKKSKPE